MSAVIKNALVFDGRKFVGVRDVAIDGKFIADSAPEGAEVIDGTGKTLLPGLWDCHVHIYDRPDFLEKSLRWGNTTICDMGCRERETVDKMKGLRIVNILSPYSFACAPTSGAPENMRYPAWTRMKTPEDGVAFVDKMVSWGADYIKIIIEEESGAGRNGGAEYPLEIGCAILEEAHKNGKKVVSHATDLASFRKAAEIGVDVITHMPMTGEMPDEVVERVIRQGETLTPTITMMDAIAANIKKARPQAPVSKRTAEENLKKFIKAGANILVSTDANEDDPCPPASVEYGKGLLDEILNMRECGMDAEEILARTTSLPAEYFGQPERGAIAPGKIADLLLVDGDLSENLENIYRTAAVWFEGEKKA